MLDPKLVPTPLLLEDERSVVVVEPPRPKRFRWVEIVLAFARYFGALARLRLAGRLQARDAGERARRTAESLGGFWMKAAQVLSLRFDVLPWEFCKELMKVTDQATGFPGDIARRIVEEELGRPIDAAFVEWGERPIAAASIGQVHRARLREGGHAVVVKVQRPGIEETFRKDMAFLRFLFRSFARFRRFANWRLMECVRELEAVLVEELDYLREANGQKRMRKLLRKHGIHAPKVWSELSTRRVLVMEEVRGVLMSDFVVARNADPERALAWLRENDVDAALVGRRLHLSHLRQLLEDPLFHSDLHPGNIVLLRESEVALIDFGAIGRMYPDFQTNFTLYYLGLQTREYSKAAERLLRIFEPIPPIDLPRLRREIVRLMRQLDSTVGVRGLPFHERCGFNFYAEVPRLLASYGLSANWIFLRICRATYTLYFCLQHLCDETFNIQEEFGVHFRRSGRRLARRMAAREKRTAEAEWSAVLLREMPERITELQHDTGVALQRSALRFEATTSKTAHAYSGVIGLVRFALLAAAGFILLVFLDQRLWRIPVEGTSSRLDDALHRIPTLGGLDWLVLAVVLFALLSITRQVGARLRRLSSPK